MMLVCDVYPSICLRRCQPFSYGSFSGAYRDGIGPFLIIFVSSQSVVPAFSFSARITFCASAAPGDRLNAAIIKPNHKLEWSRFMVLRFRGDGGGPCC